MALPRELQDAANWLFADQHSAGRQAMRELYLHPENRYVVACLIGAAVIDDPRMFGIWCKHGAELLEQFRRGDRDERVMFERANTQLEGMPNVRMGGDPIPLAQAAGREPSPEQLAAWNQRFARNAAAGAYHDPDAAQRAYVPGAQFANTPVQSQDSGQMSALVQDLVRKELASLQGSQYGANSMPQPPTLQSWPPPVIRPLPQWTGGAPGPPLGYVPGRR